MGDSRYNKRKNLIFNNRIFLKKKIICITLIIILISTVFSPVTSSKDTQNSVDNNSDFFYDESEKPLRYKLGNLIEDIIEINKELRFEIIPLHVVTNHNGSEKTTKLRLILPTTIDVNGDGSKDIRVWTFRRPGIDLRPIAVCMKTTLFIRRLPGMDLIKNDDLEVYLEYLPRIISKISGGTLDRIRIGYQSPKDEEIPSYCSVTHTYAPHIIYPRRKPKHKFSINPGSISGNSKLNLIASVADLSGDNVSSEHSFRIDSNPSAKTELSISRLANNNKIKIELDSKAESDVKIYYTKQELNDETSVGLLIEKLSSFSFEISLKRLLQRTSFIEYEQVSSNLLNITLFIENQDNSYFYIRKLPDHITLTWLPKEKGWMTLDTYGHSVEEIGFKDDLLYPTTKVFVSDLPTYVTLNWDMFQKKNFKTGTMTISSDTAGCSAHLIKTPNPPLLDENVSSTQIDLTTEDNINLTISWDYSKNLFTINQSQTDLDLFMLVTDENGNKFQGTATLKHLWDKPITIYYDKFNDGKAEMKLIGRTFDIYDLNIDMHLTEIGDFTIFMDQLSRSSKGDLNISFFVENKNHTIQCNCSFEITGGIEIYNLKLGYNGFWYNTTYINVGENDTIYFEFGGEMQIFYEISDDFSWGYISITGSAYLNLDFPFDWNGTKGRVKGEIYLETSDKAFNVSWKTISGERKITIDGKGLFDLYDFHLWFGDIIDLKIPRLKGSIMVKDASKESGFFKYEFEGAGSINLNLNFMTNESHFIMNLSMNAHFENTGRPASITVEWTNYNETTYNFDVSNGFTLFIDDLDLKIIEDENQTITIENLSAYFNGAINLYTNNSNETVALGFKDTDVYLHIDYFNDSGADFGEIEFSANATGIVNISLLNFSTAEHIPEYYLDVNMTYYNFSLLVDANKGSLSLNKLFIEHLMNYSVINLKNFYLSNGISKINLSFSINQTEMVARFVHVKFNNSPGTIILLDDFSFDMYLLGVDIPPIPTTVYSGKLIEGVFDIYIRFFEVVAFEVVDGSAVDNLGVCVTPPADNNEDPDFYLYFYFDEPVDYLSFDVNAGYTDISYPLNNFIYIESKNMTVPLNISLIVPASKLPYSDDDFGLRFDDVILQADEFILFTPNLWTYPYNPNFIDFNTSGYLHLEGEGYIWMLLNGVWQKLYHYDGVLTIHPGHLNLAIDGEIELDHTIVLRDGSWLTIAGDFSADNCVIDMNWDELKTNFSMSYSGSVEIQDFVFRIENKTSPDDTYFEITFDSLLLSASQEITFEIYDVIYELNIPDGVLIIDDFKYEIVNESQTTKQLSFSNLDLIGPVHFLAYLDFEVVYESELYITGNVNSFFVSDLNLIDLDKYLEIEAIDIEGEFNISILPEPENSFNYIGIKIYINGIFEINNIVSSEQNINQINNFYFNGAGDIQLEKYEDTDIDTHIVLVSQNGIDLEELTVELDDGRKLVLKKHTTSGISHISQGFIHSEWNIDQDADGFVFLDSSDIDFDNVDMIFHRKRSLGWGIRLFSITHHFNANAWMVQWDPLYYNPNLGIFLIRPLSIEISGGITNGEIDLDITDGNYWYNLWPLIS